MVVTVKADIGLTRKVVKGVLCACVHMPVCVCVCRCMCVYVPMRASACTCVCVHPQVLSTLLFETVSQWPEAHLIRLGWLTS